MTFKCQCIACIENYPLVNRLPKKRLVIPTSVAAAINNSFQFDRERSLANWQWVVDFLQNNDKHMPCSELANAFKYYTSIIKIIYTKQVCIEMRVNPVTNLNDITHGIRRMSSN